MSVFEKSVLQDMSVDHYRKEFRLDLPVGSNFQYRNYWSALRDLNGHCIFNYAKDDNYTSRDFIIVGDVTKMRFLLVGAVTAKRSSTYLNVIVRGGRFDTLTITQPEIAGGQEPEEVVCLEGEDWRQLLIEYAELAAQKMGSVADRDRKSPVTGYCSWYYYYENTSEAQMLERVAELENRRDMLAVKYFQIDDGYQLHHGDWLTRREGWPRPLAQTAQRIQDAGMVPGIWTMPLVACTASKTFQRHPDWFVTGPNGQPVLMKGWSSPPEDQWACLDASNPHVIAHLQDVYGQLYEYGFRYFKCDGLHFGLCRGRRHDPDATSVSAFRQGLTAVKEAIQDSWMLGCVSPVLETVGIVDSLRVGCDTNAQWQVTAVSERPESGGAMSLHTPNRNALCNALKTTFSQWWTFDRYFRADPDVVVARDNKSELTPGQARMSALSAIVAGTVFTSDAVSEMNPQRLEILQIAMQHTMTQVKPVAILPSPDYIIFEGICGDRKAAAIFNFGPAHTFTLEDVLGGGNYMEAFSSCECETPEIAVASQDAALLICR